MVPFTSFSENEIQPDGSRPPAWFALDESRPLAFFAGIWTRWKSVRKAKEGETENDICAFLTTKPNAVVRPIHQKAMPVILTTANEIETWMSAPTKIAIGPGASSVEIGQGRRKMPNHNQRYPTLQHRNYDVSF